jgi:hypothetical protein
VKVDLPGLDKPGFALRGFDDKAKMSLLKNGIDGVKNLFGGGESKANDSAGSSVAPATSTDSSTNKGFWKRNAPAILGGDPNRPRASLKIPSEGKEVDVDVELKGGGLLGLNKQAKAGIAALQIGEHKTAVEEFSAAVKDKPKNESYQFALAVAMELTGDYAGAKKHYAEANKLAGGAGSAAAQAGLKRLEAREK